MPPTPPTDQLVVTGPDRESLLELLKQLASSTDETVEVGAKVFKHLMRHSYDFAYKPMWLLLGSLTDKHDFHPEEDAKTSNEMRELAGGFLEIQGDIDRERQFFNHWVYERHGYSRPTLDSSVLLELAEKHGLPQSRVLAVVLRTAHTAGVRELPDGDKISGASWYDDHNRHVHTLTPGDVSMPAILQFVDDWSTAMRDAGFQGTVHRV